MEEPRIRTSIRSLYARIINTFTELIQEFENSKSRPAEELTLDDLEDVRGRLRLWAGNSGAHRTGRVSLDHKLRYSSQVHDKVTEYLEALDNALRNGTCCVSLAYRLLNMICSYFDLQKWRHDSPIPALAILFLGILLR